MIASLRGILIDKQADGAVIECGGVGYGVAMPISSLVRMGQLGDEVKVLVETSLSQDALRLFGFLETSERDVFRVLVGINGVGPKLALAVLSVFSAEELCDIVAREDKPRLVKIPGVGGKKADRLLLELKDRLPKLMIQPEVAGSVIEVSIGPKDDLVDAMLALGFKNAIAEKAANTALERLPDEGDIATLVREALRVATPRA
jgi:Holliday junction DNA helicase RuvA